MKMRATYGIYEDPSLSSFSDVWDTSGDPNAKRKETIRVVCAAVGLMSMGAVASYAAYVWKYGTPQFFSSLPPAFSKFTFA
ncbi:hypothetical protein GYMLUDRAFT_73498 [Collybiopsis luxurians FD-317 M1]|uniref:Uncharacterized protein n=1 Tax=Collybiopsis luxurians FD-317 M1 TaxID=944289 RepID=A0A0D0BZ05_9AGAR|nr:hypothetical protein GYMLUDRAFT_73498 [Collybiopsis luxurians FD-317 M1]